MSENPSNLTSLGLRPGDKVDKFEIVGQIGQGGTSIVWKGYDRLLDRFVAIKQISHATAASSGGNEEAFRERFRNEAGLQKKIAGQGKNLVRIYELIEDPRGLFIVMEFVDGQNLDQYIAATKGPMDQTTALGIVGATAMALSAIHQGGVIHRDLKPSNILLPKEGGLKVCDFGLATLIGEQDAQDAGSVRYMAPEAFSGDETDARADFYSLGMIAYEMLAGRPKFEEAFKIVLRDQRNQALRWMKWHTNPRVSAPPLHELNPAVPRKLSDLVARMMEKDPDQRIGSASELIEAIRRHFSGHHEPHAAMMPQGDAASNAAEPTAALPKRSKLPLILAAMLGFWVVVGLGVYLYFDSQAKNVVAARRDAAVTEYMAAKADFDEKHDYAGTEPIFAKLATDWADDARLSSMSRAHMLYAQADAAMKVGDYAQAIKLLEEADKLKVLNRDLIATARADAITRQGAGQLTGEIEELIRQRRFQEARNKRQSVLDLKSVELTPEEKAKLDELGNYIEDQERLHLVDTILEQAQQMADNGERDAAITFLEQKYTQYNNRKIDDLRKELRRADDQQQALAAMQQAEAKSDWPQALIAARRVLRFNREDQATQKKLQYFQGRAAYDLARQKEQEGDLPGAIKLYRDALAMADYQPAQAELERLKVTGEKAGILQAGDSAMASGNYDVAIRHYQDYLKISPDSAVSGKLRDARVNKALQEARNALGDGKLDEAKKALATVAQLDAGNAAAADITQKIGQITDYRAHLAKGDAYRAQSKFGEAKREYNKASDILNTPEVAQRKADTEYESMVAFARRDVEAENWVGAKGWLNTARGIRDTEEVRKMLEIVNKKLGEKPQVEE